MKQRELDERMDCEATKAAQANRVRKATRKKGPQCYGCEGYGHIAREYANKRKKDKLEKSNSDRRRRTNVTIAARSRPKEDEKRKSTGCDTENRRNTSSWPKPPPGASTSPISMGRATESYG